ncbi:hypothetical protein Forpi1262_v001158 [Fusarium oxysporum f. sp. raphani]|uniref:Uncharacterized protein n=1 Tax=Fusarium oxysporum f. sp. raphani TaxID=96318 RepID=A0A8J5UC99_FUSOX|nr:hypothetical protein Forpi1262_v001158 [Fusarium oxysporum f. sp. raphani]
MEEGLSSWLNSIDLVQHKEGTLADPSKVRFHFIRWYTTQTPRTLPPLESATTGAHPGQASALSTTSTGDFATGAPSTSKAVDKREKGLFLFQ